MGETAKYRYENQPIPTYEEATSSRPPSSNRARGPEESSDDAERQGLLGRQPSHVPTVESPRSSSDSVPEMIVDEGGDVDHRNIEELDYLDPSTDIPRRQQRTYHRVRIRKQISDSLASLSASLSTLRLPNLRSFLPSAPFVWFQALASRLPIPAEGVSFSLPIVARLAGLAIIGSLVWLLFAFDIIGNRRIRLGGQFDPESVRQYVQEHVDAESIQGYLYHITSYDHVAGTEGDYYLGKWMMEKWAEVGLLDDVAMLEYQVYLNYPREGDRSVEITSPEDKKWTAKLEEDQVYPDRVQTLNWHGHSRSGDVSGHLVYANGGSRKDFAYLQSHGVVTNGSIALVRYYTTQGDRALKIKAAEEAGCVGVLIYSDPTEDGSVRGPVWPDGPWRPADAVQRGGVSLMSWVVGDPLTPGWASTANAERVSKLDNPGLPNIPSLPLAWRDAKALLAAIDGVGRKVPNDWILSQAEVPTRWTGNTGTAAPIIRLKNMNDENEKQPIWNLHGLIEGIETGQKKVIVGNHRDSWCFGSVDPGSGSAVLMEVVSLLGELRKLGWRPLRTIEFVSWDAEEYNLVGSTEYVEDNMDNLRDNGVAYLNVDVGVFGDNFRAAGSPVFQRALNHVLDRVTDPVRNVTLKQLWDEKGVGLEGLGAGSDYVAFQDMAGTSSIDFGFQGPENGYPYHSCYETFDWMIKFGDPGFKYHVTLAQVWALLILEIADRPIIPFDLRVYAKAVKGYIMQLEQDIGAHATDAEAGDVEYKARLKKAFQDLNDAVDLMAGNAETFHHFEDMWTANVLGAGGFEPTNFALQRIDYNERIARFETDLLDLPTTSADERPHGVPGREQFKHVIFGPQAWSGYDEAYFPAVRDAMETRNRTGLVDMVERAAEVIKRASERLIAL